MATINVTKELAVEEDLAVGIGTVEQERGTMTLINSDSIPHSSSTSISDELFLRLRTTGGVMTGTITMGDGTNLAEILFKGNGTTSGLQFQQSDGVLRGALFLDEVSPDTMVLATFDANGIALGKVEFANDFEYHKETVIGNLNAFFRISDTDGERVRLGYNSGTDLTELVASVADTAHSGISFRLDGNVASIFGATPSDPTDLTPKQYVDDAVANVVGGVKYVGTWDASGGVYPTTQPPEGTGVALEAGNMFIVDVAGTISAVVWSVGDNMIRNSTNDGWDQVVPVSTSLQLSGGTMVGDILMGDGATKATMAFRGNGTTSGLTFAQSDGVVRGAIFHDETTADNMILATYDVLGNDLGTLEFAADLEYNKTGTANNVLLNLTDDTGIKLRAGYVEAEGFSHIVGSSVEGGINFLSDGNVASRRGTTPVNPADLTTKAYVDAQASAGGLPTTGGTMTGDINLGDGTVLAQLNLQGNGSATPTNSGIKFKQLDGVIRGSIGHDETTANNMLLTTFDSVGTKVSSVQFAGDFEYNKSGTANNILMNITDDTGIRLRMGYEAAADISSIYAYSGTTAISGLTFQPDGNVRSLFGSNPINGADLATKNYVDSQAGGASLPLTGGTMTGIISMGLDTTSNTYIDMYSPATGLRFYNSSKQLVGKMEDSSGFMQLTTYETSGALRSYIRYNTDFEYHKTGSANNVLVSAQDDTGIRCRFGYVASEGHSHIQGFVNNTTNMGGINFLADGNVASRSGSTPVNPNDLVTKAYHDAVVAAAVEAAIAPLVARLVVLEGV